MRILQKISFIYTACILLLLGIILMPLRNKIINETGNSVALAVEYNDIADFFGKERFSDFKNAGIAAVVLSDEKAKDFFSDTEKDKYKKLPREKYLGISADKRAHLTKLNLDMIFQITGDASLLPAKNQNVLSVIMSDESYGEPPADSGYTFGILEFSKQKEIIKIMRDKPEGFRVLKLQWEKDFEKNIQRIRRAALERNVRIIILDMSQTTVENALEYVEQAKNILKEIGFTAENPVPVKNINPLLSKYSLFTKIISFLTALLSPLLLCFVFMNTPFRPEFLQKYPLLKIFTVFLAITAFSLISGTVIAGLLSTKDFMLGIDLFRGIKIVLILPIILSVLLLYRDNIKNIVNKPLLYGELLLLGVIAAAIGFYVIRSGNSGFMSSAEEILRIFLEKIFLVRPRLKEFLIGHPFMLAAIYLKYKENNHHWKPLFLIGLFGQISIINTFCHIHSPFFISLLRTFNGMCLGTILGITLIYLYNKFIKELTTNEH